MGSATNWLESSPLTGRTHGLYDTTVSWVAGHDSPGVVGMIVVQREDDKVQYLYLNREEADRPGSLELSGVS